MAMVHQEQKGCKQQQDLSNSRIAKTAGMLKTPSTKLQQGDKQQQGLQGLQNIGNSRIDSRSRLIRNIMDNFSNRNACNCRSARISFTINVRTYLLIKTYRIY